jgi:hypothetical protein
MNGNTIRRAQLFTLIFFLDSPKRYQITYNSVQGI